MWVALVAKRANNALDSRIAVKLRFGIVTEIVVFREALKRIQHGISDSSVLENLQARIAVGIPQRTAPEYERDTSSNPRFFRGRFPPETRMFLHGISQTLGKIPAKEGGHKHNRHEDHAFEGTI